MLIVDTVQTDLERWPITAKAAQGAVEAVATRYDWIVDVLIPAGGGFWREIDFNYQQTFTGQTPEDVLDAIEARMTNGKRTFNLNGQNGPTSCMGSALELLGRQPTQDDELALVVMSDLAQVSTDGMWAATVTLKAVRVDTMQDGSRVYMQES